MSTLIESYQAVDGGFARIPVFDGPAGPGSVTLEAPSELPASNPDYVYQLSFWNINGSIPDNSGPSITVAVPGDGGVFLVTAWYSLAGPFGQQGGPTPPVQVEALMFSMDANNGAGEFLPPTPIASVTPSGVWPPASGADAGNYHFVSNAGQVVITAIPGPLNLNISGVPNADMFLQWLVPPGGGTGFTISGTELTVPAPPAPGSGITAVACYRARPFKERTKDIVKEKEHKLESKDVKEKEHKFEIKEIDTGKFERDISKIYYDSAGVPFGFGGPQLQQHGVVSPEVSSVLTQLTTQVTQLSQRISRLERMVATQRPFISQQERPPVGEQIRGQKAPAPAARSSREKSPPR